MTCIVSFTDSRPNVLLENLSPDTLISDIEKKLNNNIEDGRVMGLVIAGKQCNPNDRLSDYSFNKNGISILCVISKAKSKEKFFDEHQLSIKMKEIHNVKEHVDLCIKNYNNPLNFDLKRDALNEKATQRSSEVYYPKEAKEFFKFMKSRISDDIPDDLDIPKPESINWSKVLNFDIESIMSEAYNTYPDYNDILNIKEKIQSMNNDASDEIVGLCDYILKTLKDTHNETTKTNLKESILEVYKVLNEAYERPEILNDAKEGMYDFHDQILDYNSNDQMDLKNYNILMKNLKDIDMKINVKLETLKNLKSKHKDFQLTHSIQSLNQIADLKKEIEQNKKKFETDLKKMKEKQKEFKEFYSRYIKDLDEQIKQREELIVNFKDERSYIKTLILELLQRYVQNKKESTKLEREIKKIDECKKEFLQDSTNEDILMENYKILLENKINDCISSSNSYQESERVIQSCLSKLEDMNIKNKEVYNEQTSILLSEKFKLNADIYALLYSEYQRYKHLQKLELDDLPRMQESIQSRRMLGDIEGVKEFESVIKRTQEKNKQIEEKITEIKKRISEVNETLKGINKELVDLGRTPLPEPHEEAEELCKSRFGSIIL